jgi:hypothetical protein
MAGVTNPSVSFHRKTFGQNIQLDDNGSSATRYTSFDNGYFHICFIYLKRFIMILLL